METLLCAKSAFLTGMHLKTHLSQKKKKDIRAAAAYLPAPRNRNLQWKCGYSPPKLSWDDLLHSGHWLLHKNWCKFSKLLALELGIWAGCVSGSEQLAWMLTQKSSTTVQPGQDTTQPAAECFSFVVTELFQKPSFHCKRAKKKKPTKPIKSSAHPSLDWLFLQLVIV